MRLMEVSLELSVSADVKRNAMRPTTQHLRVAQFQRNYIKTLLFQQLDQRPADFDRPRPNSD